MECLHQLPTCRGGANLVYLLFNLQPLAGCLSFLPSFLIIQRTSSGFITCSKHAHLSSLCPVGMKSLLSTSIFVNRRKNFYWGQKANMREEAGAESRPITKQKAERRWTVDHFLNRVLKAEGFSWQPWWRCWTSLSKYLKEAKEGGRLQICSG